MPCEHVYHCVVGVAPFPGATTGTGGRIRDVHCTGRGAFVVAGTAGYSFGNLNIPGSYKCPFIELSLSKEEYKVFLFLQVIFLKAESQPSIF